MKGKGGKMDGNALLARALQNKHITITGLDAVTPNVTPVTPAVTAEPPKLKRKRRRVMNGVESRYHRILEAMVARGEIVSFGFETMTLRWGTNEDFTYTPDFYVVVSVFRHSDVHREPGSTVPTPSLVQLRFVEVKGPHIRQKDWDRFKHARDNFPLFEFQFWQEIKREWNQHA